MTTTASPAFVPHKTTESISPAPIFRLPREVLFAILSLVVPSLRPNGWPKTLRDSPFHVIRSTCRIFRRLADELPFWDRDNFDFQREAIVFSRARWSTESVVQLLVSDTHLQQRLSSKTGWYFTEPSLFQVLSGKIPNFGASVRSLKLLAMVWGKFFCWGEIAHELKTTFTSLTYLDIISNDHVHMNKLPPSLQTLIIITPFAKCNCSNTLPNLQTFNIADTGSHVSQLTEPLKFQKLLPFNSKSTLTCFTVLLPDHPPSNQYVDGMRRLIEFVHITDLTIRPLTREMCTILLGSSLRLTTFKTRSLWEDQLHTGPLLNLLDSPVLENVKTFEYDYRNYEGFKDERIPLFEPLIRALSSHRDLDHLELCYPIHEPWFQHLRSCSNLHDIVWDFSFFPPPEMSMHSDFEDYRLTEALREALDNIDPAPRVEVNSRKFLGRARVVIQNYNVDSDSTDTDNWETTESESGESDAEKSE